MSSESPNDLTFAASLLPEGNDLKQMLREAMNRVSQLEVKDEQQRALLENLFLHQEELRVQNEELRRVQSSLEAARQRHQALFDFAPVAHFLVSSTGMILRSNRAASTLLGLTAQELQGFHIPNMAGSQQQRVAVLALVEGIAREPAPPAIEVELFHRDGSRIRTQMHASRSGSGQEASVLLTAVDISHRVALEKERARVRLEKRLGPVLFDRYPEPAFVADASWGLTRVNQAFLQMTGHSAEQVLGSKLDAIIFPPGDDVLAWQAWQALQDGGYWHGRVSPRLAAADGQSPEMLMELIAVADAEDAERSYLCLLRQS